MFRCIMLYLLNGSRTEDSDLRKRKIKLLSPLSKANTDTGAGRSSHPCLLPYWDSSTQLDAWQEEEGVWGDTQCILQCFVVYGEALHSLMIRKSSGSNACIFQRITCCWSLAQFLCIRREANFHLLDLTLVEFLLVIAVCARGSLCQLSIKVQILVR